MTNNREMGAAAIRDILSQKFSSPVIEVIDESYRHIGHPAATLSGGGHYRVVVVSDFFEAKTLLERHQAVYDALEISKHDLIHALKVKTYTTQEWKTAGGSKNFNRQGEKR